MPPHLDDLTLLAWLFVAGSLAVACGQERRPAPMSTPSAAPVAEEDAALPDYLVRLATNADLYARDGGAIVSAPRADIAVVEMYPLWKDKGPLSGAGGERLTILTAKAIYAAGEEVRVVHVHEVTRPGVTLYVMGPKAIFGEYVDGKLASTAVAPTLDVYDGAVRPSPDADHNYEVSVYRLPVGMHTIQWRFATRSGPAVLASNVLRVEVR